MKFQPIVFFVGFFWTLSFLYCLRWHYKKGNLNYGTFFVSLIIGPAIVNILILHDYSEKKERKELEERENNNRHTRWYRTMGEINRQRIQSFGRTIPPPPPISRIEPPNRKYNNKDFKFFQK